VGGRPRLPCNCALAQHSSARRSGAELKPGDIVIGTAPRQHPRRRRRTFSGSRALGVDVRTSLRRAALRQNRCATGHRQGRGAVSAKIIDWRAHDIPIRRERSAGRRALTRRRNRR
jgi:hypothetical protein